MTITTEEQAWEVLATGGYLALAGTIFHPQYAARRATAEEAAAIDYLCAHEGYVTTNDPSVVQTLHEAATPPIEPDADGAGRQIT
jgi:hypothetical protein